MKADTLMAEQRWELENEIIQEDIIFSFDEAEEDRLYAAKPWKKE